MTFTTNANSADAKVVLTGTAGTDVLFGGALNDTIIGVGDVDAMAGDGGDDVFVYNGETDLLAGEYFEGGEGTDTIELNGAFNDQFDFTSVALSSIEVLTFEDRAVRASFNASQIGMFTEINGLDISHFLNIFGTVIDLSAISFPVWDPVFNVVILHGTDDSDSIIGSSQYDAIYSADGDDVIDAGGGDDDITGGLGRDEMTGGAGSDDFFYGDLEETPTGTGRDRIEDFVQGEDHINLQDLYYYNFTFIADAALSATGDAEINYVQTDTTTIVQIDADGDGTVESKIVLTGLIDLTADDFIL